MSIKILRDKVLNKIILIGDYFDFSKILKETFFEEQKEDSFLIKLQPVSIDLNAKEILVSEEKSIFNVNSKMRYDNKLFKKVTLEAKLKNDKNFNINIKNHNESRELNIFSDDAGNFLNTFNINKSGKGGEFVLHGKQALLLEK